MEKLKLDYNFKSGVPENVELFEKLIREGWHIDKVISSLGSCEYYELEIKLTR